MFHLGGEKKEKRGVALNLPSEQIIAFPVRKSTEPASTTAFAIINLGISAFVLKGTAASPVGTWAGWRWQWY